MDKNVLSGVRASFDFELIPHHLFESGREFIESVALGKGEFLAGLMNIYYLSAAKELGLEQDKLPQFSEEQFKVFNCMIGEDVVLVLIELPEDKGDEITCKYYVFADDREENLLRFFTVENEDGEYVMGEVTPEKHYIFGDIPCDINVIARTAGNIMYQNK